MEKIVNKIIKTGKVDWRNCEWLQPDDLKKYSESQWKKLKTSLVKNGFISPFILWQSKDKNYILDAHHRQKAFKELEEIDNIIIPSKLPAIWIDCKNKKEAKKNILIYNSHYADIQQDNLIDWIKDLDFDEINNEIEIKGIDIIEPIAETDNDDEVPENVKVVTKLGDLWELGKHRVLCGDSTKIEDVERLMNGNKADMVFTDPPYGIDLDTDWSNAKSDLRFYKEKKCQGTGNKYKKVKGDNVAYNPKHIFDLFNCKEIFLWGADYYADKIPDRNKGCFIVWDKRSNDNTDIEKVNRTDKMYGSLFELCWSKKNHQRLIARVKWAGIFGTETEPDRDKSRKHPTQKPVLLGEWFLNRYSKQNDLILDIFLGSGSTLIACEKTNRICYGMELDEYYVSVVVNRYNNWCIDNNIKPEIKLNGKKYNIE